jgi:hypothetical protein
VNGSGYVYDSLVRWNGSDLETTFVSGTQLQATLPSSLLAEVSPVEVSVFTPAPGGGQSGVAVFFVTAEGVDVTAYDSGTSTDGSGASAQAGNVSAIARGGNGRIVAAEYSQNPGGEPGFVSAGIFFDIYLSLGNTFDEVQGEVCNTETGTIAYWWDNSNWMEVSDQSYDSQSGCISIDIDDTATPSITDLTGTPFALADGSPAMTADLASQDVQYSDGIIPVTFAATDIGETSIVETRWTAEDGTENDGLPEGLFLTPASCSQPGDSTLTTCEWMLAGAANIAAGIYEIKISAADAAGSTSEVIVTLVVSPEETSTSFHGGNPVAVQVSGLGGDSGPFTFDLSMRELIPDEGTDPFPGDIVLAQAAVALVPVGPGSTVEPTSCTSDVTGTGYDATLRLSCNFDQVPVNTYAAVVEVQDGYYQTAAEDVLTVYDPTLGYASGGGWFYWPGTDHKTSFGFTMEYNNKGTNVKGSLLLIRHLPNGTYRVKSNALYGLALGENPDEQLGWASFNGKATYSEPGWAEAEGNHEFVLYVEDQNEPGSGTDRIWLQVKDKDGATILSISMDEPAATKAMDIQDGNIVVTHGG